MFKYIKRLLSVVVMFATLFVFSSNNVYANERNYNPFLIMFMHTIDLDVTYKFMADNLTDDEYNEIYMRMNDIEDINNPPYRKGKIQLKQKDMREYFDCKWNDDINKFELTEKGKADFEKSKDKGGEGGSEGGGHM